MNPKRILQTSPPPGFIDLGMGNPDVDLLPLTLLQLAAEKYFSRGDPNTLQYGAEQGNGYFLDSLSGFLETGYGSKVSPDSLFTTTGASSALDLLCTLYTQAGDLIYVEEPSYFLALRIFQDHRLQVVPVPMDEDGLQVDIMEEMLKKFQPKFIYTIPTHHNPSGRTLTQERREQLVQLAQKHNFLVIADEVYHFLSYTQTPPPPLAVFTTEVEQIISINSFSKILAPGLRLGWIQAHNKVIDRLAGCGLLDSGGGMNPFTSAIVRHFIDSGDLVKNIARLRPTYLERLNVLCTALDQHLPQVEYSRSHGGFFLWVRFPGQDTSLLRKELARYKVDLRPGELFSSQAGLKEFARLGFCYYPPDDLEKGVRRLHNCLQQG